MTIDPTLAALSDTLFSVTVALYSLAVVAFCAQLAFGRRPAHVCCYALEPRWTATACP